MEPYTKAFSVSYLADGILTWIGIRLVGLREANPFWGTVSPEVLLLTKIIVLGVILAGFTLIDPKLRLTLNKYTMRPFAILFLGVVAWNFLQIYQGIAA